MVADDPLHPAGSSPAPAALDAAALFAGAADFYQRYRPRYPDALFADLMDRCGIARGKRVLDLGCGPGFIAVPLAALGVEVIAVDPQPEMLEAGRVAAAELGCGGITWIEGTSESLGPDVAPVCCATLGRSFHWMQREAVLAFLDSVIEPCGSVVLVEEERPQPIAWREAVRDYVNTWHGGKSPAHGRNTRRQSGLPHREVLAASPFSRLEMLNYPVARHWSIDRIVGYVYSTSAANPQRLGDHRRAFEAGLRERLASLPGAPDFVEQAEVVATLATRPPREEHDGR